MHGTLIVGLAVWVERERTFCRVGRHGWVVQVTGILTDVPR